ncbi:MAG: C-GCAxxG-C-C family protein [Syntrophotaleaceae bacterium]
MNELSCMLELAQKGYYCSQILLALGLENCGRTNPDLIRTMAGLAHGAGFGDGTCGALTGGMCLLAFYSAQGSDDEEEHVAFMGMRMQLADWFKEFYGEQYGGIDCASIVGDDPDPKLRCGQIVGAVYLKVKEILAENDFELSECKA